MTDVVDNKSRFDMRRDANAATTSAEALELVQEINRLGPTFMAQNLWANGKRGFGLRFDLGGMGRFGAVIGWICGLCNRETYSHAEKAAFDFVRVLDYLANYGGMADDEETVPRYVIVLGDDGLPNSFRLMWYAAVDYYASVAPDETLSAGLFYGGHGTTAHKDRSYRTNKTYVFKIAFNGGLIYSGPDAGDLFTVTLGSSNSWWGVHT